MSLRKSPQQCQSLADIRVEVNRIDQELVALLAERNGYAEAAAAFKKSEEEIRSPDHLDAFFTERKRQAREAGLDEAMVERIYKAIVERSIEMHLALWRRAARP
jgi:isochorismate pyruvate lyase